MSKTRLEIKREELIEQVAEGIWQAQYILDFANLNPPPAPDDAWATWPDINRDYYRTLARAAFKAVKRFRAEDRKDYLKAYYTAHAEELKVYQREYQRRKRAQAKAEGVGVGG